MTTSRGMEVILDRMVGALGASIAQDDYLAGEAYSGNEGDDMGTDETVQVE